MPGVEITAKADTPVGWAEEAKGFIDLMQSNPENLFILFFCVLVIVAILPGGVVASFLKLRAAKLELESKRATDIQPALKNVTKRMERRKIGRSKERKDS